MLRAVSIFVKDRVVYANGVLQEYDTMLMDNISTVSISHLDKTQYVSAIRLMNQTKFNYIFVEMSWTSFGNNDFN